MKIRTLGFEITVALSRLRMSNGKNYEMWRIEELGQIASTIRVIFHHGDAATGSEHIYRQWRDVFIESNVPFVAMFRNKKIYLKAAQEFPNDPLVLVTGNEFVPEFINQLPSLRAIMYSGNTGNIVHLLQFPKLNHCFIGHGDSDKNASATKVFRVYDEIWVAGKAHIERLAELGTNWRFRIVGRPQAAGLLSQESYKRKSICYLPTWEGPNKDNMYCSLGLIDDILKCLKSTSDEVQVKLHPCTGFRLKNIKSIKDAIVKSGLPYVDLNLPIKSVMQDAEICVTDNSSVLSDWIVSQRPAIVYVPGGVDRSKLAFSKYCYIYSTVAELQGIVENIFSGIDPLKNNRAEAAAHRVDIVATLNNEFIRNLRDVSGLN